MEPSFNFGINIIKKSMKQLSLHPVLQLVTLILVLAQSFCIDKYKLYIEVSASPVSRFMCKLDLFVEMAIF